MSCYKFLSNNNLVNDLLVPMLDWCELNRFTHTEKSKVQLFEMKLLRNPTTIPKGQKELLIDPDYLLTLLQSLIEEYNGNWVSFTKSLYPLQSVRSVYIDNFESLIPIHKQNDNDQNDNEQNDNENHYDEQKLYNYIVHKIKKKQANEVEEQSREQFVASCSDMILEPGSEKSSSEKYLLLDREIQMDVFNSLTMRVLRKVFRCLTTAVGKTHNLLVGDTGHRESIETLQATDLSHQNLDYLVEQGNFSQDQLFAGKGTWSICLIELLPAFTHLRRIIMGHQEEISAISDLLRNNASTLELFLVTNLCGTWVNRLFDATLNFDETQNLIYPCMTYFNAGFDERDNDLKEIETVISAFPRVQKLYLHSHLEKPVIYSFEFWELVFSTWKQLQFVSVGYGQFHSGEWTITQQQQFEVWKQGLVVFQIQ